MVEFGYHGEWYTLLIIDIINWNDLEKFGNNQKSFSLKQFRPEKVFIDFNWNKINWMINSTFSSNLELLF